jgi:ribonuclease HII
VATLAQLMAETYRLTLVRSLEDRLYLAGFGRIAGVDEVGRGCLAGPVVAAAVIPRPGRGIPGVDDSKKVSVEERERLAELIQEDALAFSVVAVPAATIDCINILESTRQAMREALWDLQTPPDIALIDAVPLSQTPCPTLSVIRGDLMSYAIASASILAKVTRDRMMRDLGTEYPQYGFGNHKGYGAPHHLEALAEFGPTPEHRLTFRSVVPRLAGRAG